jgi:hypothetical protein
MRFAKAKAQAAVHGAKLLSGVQTILFGNCLQTLGVSPQIVRADPDGSLVVLPSNDGTRDYIWRNELFNGAGFTRIKLVGPNRRAEPGTEAVWDAAYKGELPDAVVNQLQEQKCDLEETDALRTLACVSSKSASKKYHHDFYVPNHAIHRSDSAIEGDRHDYTAHDDWLAVLTPQSQSFIEEACVPLYGGVTTFRLRDRVILAQALPNSCLPTGAAGEIISFVQRSRDALVRDMERALQRMAGLDATAQALAIQQKVSLSLLPLYRNTNRLPLLL